MNTSQQNSAGDTGRVNSFDSLQLMKDRAEKDEYFRTERSPVPASLRYNFTGLRYYPPTPDFVFSVPLHRFPQAEEVTIGATKGDARTMLRFGTFSFPVNGTMQTLTVYKSEAGPNVLFIPFKDATNGDETYEVGRYLDLEEQPEGNLYKLDFNLAYNPYCAYNDSYTCPLVPRENRLPVAIRAGEQLPMLADH